jgi:FkbM family methyltransferase
MSLRRILKRLLPESHGTSPTSANQNLKFAPDEHEKDNWLRELSIKTIVDIGAHKGESARSFLSIFPDAQIHSFEPLSDCFLKLSELQKNNPRLHCYNLALGSEEATVQINRSSFSQSSSILPMGDTHKHAFPFTAGQSTEEVRVSTLDTQSSQWNPEKNILVKIDSQGYEMEVLRGATSFIEKTAVIICEVSFTQLYDSQPLFHNVYDFLLERNFRYQGSAGQLSDPRNGYPLQQDAIFMRT